MRSFGPAVTAAQSLRHQQRFLQFFRVAHGAIQTEIPAWTSVGGHPIQHELAVGVDTGVVAVLYADVDDSHLALFFTLVADEVDVD
jgi:hypothetical protein